jgi:hypothetical protein
MRRPAVDEVGLCGEMRARVHVVVLRGDDMGVLGAGALQVPADVSGHGGAPRDRERPAFAKVVLHVNDHERTAGISAHTTHMTAGYPPD